MGSWTARINDMPECKETFPGSNTPMYTDSRPSQPANPRPKTFSEGTHYTVLGDQWSCLQCTKSYKSKPALITHMNEHFDHPVHRCLDVTNKTCVNFNSLHKQQAKQHMEKWHSKGPLPFACGSCDKRYDSVSNLRHHEDRTHGFVAFYKCRHCTFAKSVRYDQVKRHYQNCHPDVSHSERPPPIVAPEQLAGQPALLDDVVDPFHGIQPNGVVANYVANDPSSPFDAANYGNVALHQQANNVMPAYNAADYGMFEPDGPLDQQVDNSNLDFLMGNQVAVNPMVNNVGNNLLYHDAVDNGTVAFNQQFDGVNYASPIGNHFAVDPRLTLNAPLFAFNAGVDQQVNQSESVSDSAHHVAVHPASHFSNAAEDGVAHYDEEEDMSNLADSESQPLDFSFEAWRAEQERAIHPALRANGTNNSNAMDLDEVFIAEDQRDTAQAQQQLAEADLFRAAVHRTWSSEQHAYFQGMQDQIGLFGQQVLYGKTEEEINDYLQWATSQPRSSSSPFMMDWA